MSPQQLPPGPPTSGLDISAVLPYLGAIITGVVGWFAALSTAPARLQTTLNGAFHTLTEELQGERARLTALVSKLEEKVEKQASRIEQLEGEVRQNLQLIESTKRTHEKPR